jgi:hypothetical protein
LIAFWGAAYSPFQTIGGFFAAFLAVLLFAPLRPREGEDFFFAFDAFFIFDAFDADFAIEALPWLW